MLCDEDVSAYDTCRKMNPPLRAPADRRALRAALASGLIDAVATDHAPHSQLEKEIEFDQAAFGVTGLETALGVMLQLVKERVLTLPRLLELMSSAPARILGLPEGRLAAGEAADVVIFDPARPWQVEAEDFYSLSRNSPFIGYTFPGRAAYTICAGRITHCLNGEKITGGLVP
jgi:dihydroorotase